MDTIAFYGTLMRGMGALESLGLEAELSYAGDCTLPGRLYDLGSYPGLQLGSGRSRGELFEFEGEGVLPALDAFEGFEPRDPSGSLFVRQRVRLPDPAVEVWVYCYNQPLSGHRVVPSGDWRSHLRERTVSSL